MHKVDEVRANLTGFSQNSACYAAHNIALDRLYTEYNDYKSLPNTVHRDVVN